MNPRRVHEIMRQPFPEVNAATRDWVVAADEYGLRRGVLEGLIDKYISGADLLVEAARKVGDFLPVALHSTLWRSTSDKATFGCRRFASRDRDGFFG